MTTPLLESRPASGVRPTPSKPTGGLLSWPGWALGWLWAFAVGAVFCTQLALSFLVLGWLGRWVRGRVLRGLYLASPRRDVVPLADACADLGERVPGRPHWFLRDGSSEKPTARTFLGRLLWPVWSVGVNLQMGLKLFVGTWLVLGWACLLLFFGWEYGWEISFGKVYERSFVGASTTFLALTLCAVLLPYALLAQVHMAVTGELKSVLDHRLIRRMIRVSLVPLIALAVLLLGFGTIFEGLKSVGRLAMGNHLGSEPTAAEIRALDGLLRTYFFWSCVGLMAALLVVKGVAARIYRGALVQLLRRGEVRPDELPLALRRWVVGLRLDAPATPVAPSRLWSAARFVGRGGLRVALFLALFLFLFRGHVGVFLTYDPGPASSFLNQPLVQAPWFGFTPGNLEELAREAEAERP